MGEHEFVGCVFKSGKQGKTVQVLRFRLLGHYPKPIEFFKLHFEEATPSAKMNKVDMGRFPILGVCPFTFEQMKCKRATMVIRKLYDFWLVETTILKS